MSTAESKTASLLLGMLLLVATAGTSVAEDLTATVKGRLYGGLRCMGFDKKPFTYSALGQTSGKINIMSTRRWRITGGVITGHTEGTNALGSVSFQRFDQVNVRLVGDRMKVRLNFKPFLPHQQRIRDGTLTFLPLTWGRDRVVLIEHPNLKIRITQPYSNIYVRYMRWLDVHISLSTPPTAEVGGILGTTLPTA